MATPPPQKTNNPEEIITMADTHRDFDGNLIENVGILKKPGTPTRSRHSSTSSYASALTDLVEEDLPKFYKFIKNIIGGIRMQMNPPKNSG